MQDRNVEDFHSGTWKQGQHREETNAASSQFPAFQEVTLSSCMVQKKQTIVSRILSATVLTVTPFLHFGRG